MLKQDYTPDEATSVAEAEVYGLWGEGHYDTAQNVYETRLLLILAKIYDETASFEPFYVLATGLAG